MSWLGSLLPSELIESNSALLLTAAVILVPALGYVLYRKYSQWNSYESVEDNELLKAKLESARRKQQEKYDQFLKENGDEMQETNKRLEKELKQSEEKSNSKAKGESFLADRDYFPLMGGGTGSTYKPEKKRGKCGGGGCG